MQIQPEISFHNLAGTPEAETEIQNHLDRLERIYGRMTTCRVRVDQRADNASHTIPPVVRIEMSVPGYKDIVVSHEPEHLLNTFQRPDLSNAINEAFRIAERRLRHFKTQRNDH